jgi:hypothetical protein
MAMPVETAPSKAVPFTATAQGNMVKVLSSPVPWSDMDARLSCDVPHARFAPAYSICGRCGQRGSRKGGKFACLNSRCGHPYSRWDGKVHFFSLLTHNMPVGLLWDAMSWDDVGSMDIRVADSVGLFPELDLTAQQMLAYRDAVIDMACADAPPPPSALVFLDRNKDMLRSMFPGSVPKQLGS